MARKVYGGDALYIAWKLGHGGRCFRTAVPNDYSLKVNSKILYCFALLGGGAGEVRALLSPAASLEQNHRAIWSDQ